MLPLGRRFLYDWLFDSRCGFFNWTRLWFAAIGTHILQVIIESATTLALNGKFVGHIDKMYLLVVTLKTTIFSRDEEIRRFFVKF
jgi:hypothetical protein